MKAVDIGYGSVAFEPNSTADNIGSLDVTRLRANGVSETVIQMYLTYRDKQAIATTAPA